MIEKNITNKDILARFYDLFTLEPNINNWSKEYFRSNEPRFYRYLQLISIFKAYNLPLNMKNFYDGTFLNNNYISKSFKILLDFRLKYCSVLAYTDGFYIVNEKQIDIIKNINHINKNIKKELKEIDDMILHLILEDTKIFTLNDLVKNYGYPDVDLCVIDIENI